MAVDEPWDRAEAAAVELLDVAVERPEVGHPAGRGDPPVVAEDVRVLDHVDVAEAVPAQGGASRAPPGVGELREVADAASRLRHGSVSC